MEASGLEAQLLPRFPCGEAELSPKASFVNPLTGRTQLFIVNYFVYYLGYRREMQLWGWLFGAGRAEPSPAAAEPRPTALGDFFPPQPLHVGFGAGRNPQPVPEASHTLFLMGNEAKSPNPNSSLSIISSSR